VMTWQYMYDIGRIRRRNVTADDSAAVDKIAYNSACIKDISAVNTSSE